MSKKSGEMLLEIKKGIETGEDKNGIKVDGLAYTWKQLEPLYQYMQSLQNEQRNLTKRNSRQRLANQKQYELILKLQQEKEDYKSRCEKASEYINEHIRIDDEYPDYMEMLVEERDYLLNILQNGSEEK